MLVKLSTASTKWDDGSSVGQSPMSFMPPWNHDLFLKVAKSHLYTSVTSQTRNISQIYFATGVTSYNKLLGAFKNSQIGDPVTKTTNRIAGLHEHLGHAWASDDFNDELPDTFWLGEE